MPKCKYCNVELEFDNTIDRDIDIDIVYLYEVGHCPKCDRDYQWVDKYNFVKFEDLEEC